MVEARSKCWRAANLRLPQTTGIGCGDGWLMSSTKIFLLSILNCFSLLLGADTLPPTLGSAIFNRQQFSGTGAGEQLNRFDIDGNFVYVADGPMGLVIYDVADPAHPRLVGRHRTRFDAVT